MNDTALLSVADPALVREVFERTEQFVPSNALTAVTELSPQALRILAREGFALPPVLASASGPEHLRVRRIVAKFFSPAKVGAVAQSIRDIARSSARLSADQLAAQGRSDLSGTVAADVPPRIMGTLLGVELPDQRLLKIWSRDSLELFWGWPDQERQLQLAQSAAQFYAWLRDSVRHAQGQQNLWGVLGAAGVPEREICSLGYFLLIAGQETTCLLIQTVLYRALRDPAIWEACARGSQDAAPNFVKRVLATESSVHTWRRAVTEDTELGPHTLPAGAEILLELSGEHLAADPYGHRLAFGHGLHRCLGARLAEMEAVIALEETARALPEAAALAVTECPESHWLRLLSFQAPLKVEVQS